MNVARIRQAARTARGELRRRLGKSPGHAPERDDFEESIASGVLTMGRHSYGRPRVRRFAGDTSVVRIGAFVAIAEEVEFIPGGAHRTDWVSTYPFRYKFNLPGRLRDGHPTSKGDIVVGNDVWIATGARILSGVTIGNGAVIAAGALVSTDVRPYAMVAGNPAKEAYRRFSDSQIEQLESLAWWNWPLEAILECVDLLCSGDVDALIRHAEGRNQTH
jgi:acetyltransferase-like isoleucine patch superfamily enzyme